MKNVNHRNIQLIYEDLRVYNTIISCELPMPKFLTDNQGKLFRKQKTIFDESGQSKILYAEEPLTHLSSVEVAAISVVDANYSVVK